MNKLTISSISGLLIGFVAGLIGVGGGEFRIPVLLQLLNIAPHQALPVNLLVGLFTVAMSLWKRIAIEPIPADLLAMAVAMVLGSLPGGYIGAFAAKKSSARLLKKILIAFLFVTGFRLLITPFFPISSNIVFAGLTTLPLAVIFGFLIGIICGLLGVAGGEYRIPSLMFLFGLGLKSAGTISLFVSLPTIAIALVKHIKNGFFLRQNISISLSMGICSVIGAYYGAAFHNVIDETLLKVFFGFILIAATVRMFVKD